MSDGELDLRAPSNHRILRSRFTTRSKVTLHRTITCIANTRSLLLTTARQVCRVLHKMH